MKIQEAEDDPQRRSEGGGIKAAVDYVEVEDE
jgi:hypothetical protein